MVEALIPTHGAMAAVCLEAARALIAAGAAGEARKWLRDAEASTKACEYPRFRKLVGAEIREVRASISTRKGRACRRPR